jgi:hypothetical protein
MLLLPQVNQHLIIFCLFFITLVVSLQEQLKTPEP